MTLRRLGPGDYRRMPWKNGGGETLEIAIGPGGAGLDGFDWRVSLARVAADGPFSVFPGVDRTLGVIAGVGIDLVFAGGHRVPLTVADGPYSFPADIEVAGRLHDGSITDLNVMTRRTRFAHAVTRLVAPRAVAIPAGGRALLYSHDGGAVTGAGPAMGPGETCFLSQGVRVAPGGSRVAFLIELGPIEGSAT